MVEGVVAESSVGIRNQQGRSENWQFIKAT